MEVVTAAACGVRAGFAGRDGAVLDPAAAPAADGALRLVYRGQLDDSRPGQGRPADGKDLRAGLVALEAGGTPAGEQRPAIGCNIKWDPGSEPEWAR